MINPLSEQLTVDEYSLRQAFIFQIRNRHNHLQAGITEFIQHSQQEVVELNDVNTVSSRIRILRQRRGLSQEQLGAECSFSQPKISKMENGACDSLSDLRIVAKALGVGMGELICESPPGQHVTACEAEKG